MASESSSAVLDLNEDPETSDAAAGALASVEDSVSPLIMEHGHDIAVKVDAPLKQLSTLETFVTYRVRCACARWPPAPPARRRYNHFKVLHARLSAANPWLAPPPLPPLHSARQQLDRYSPGFVALRALALDAFLNRVATHPILTHNDDFRIFLTTPDDEIDKVFKSENSALNLWGLSSALYGSGESKPTNGARVKDPEFSAAADYLHSLQQKLTTLCSLTTQLWKGSAGLGNEYKGMTTACSAWSSSERGGVSRALGGVARGAGAAGRARGPARGGAPRHRALLPLLAEYARAHADKIKLRDNTHAAYVAGNNSADELHNRLEQASEALRAELTDWNAKTRAEVKSLLLELATRQVQLHQQTVCGWEQALTLSHDADPSELFKTVSKTAVQNLSPSKSRQELPADEAETERDLEDFDIETYSNDGSDFQELSSRIQDGGDLSSRIQDGGHLGSRIQDGADLPRDGVASNDSPPRLDAALSVDSDKIDKLTGDALAVSDPLHDFAEVDLSRS